MQFLAAIVGALIGGVIEFYIGAYYACVWSQSYGNLCGLIGVFLTGPIGVLIGAVTGWLLARPGGGKPLS